MNYLRYRPGGVRRGGGGGVGKSSVVVVVVVTVSPMSYSGNESRYFSAAEALETISELWPL